MDFKDRRALATDILQKLARIRTILPDGQDYRLLGVVGGSFAHDARYYTQHSDIDIFIDGRNNVGSASDAIASIKKQLSQEFNCNILMNEGPFSVYGFKFTYQGQNVDLNLSPKWRDDNANQSVAEYYAACFSFGVNGVVFDKDGNHIASKNYVTDHRKKHIRLQAYPWQKNEWRRVEKLARQYPNYKIITKASFDVDEDVKRMMDSAKQRVEAMQKDGRLPAPMHKRLILRAAATLRLP